MSVLCYASDFVRKKSDAQQQGVVLRIYEEEDDDDTEGDVPLTQGQAEVLWLDGTSTIESVDVLDMLDRTFMHGDACLNPHHRGTIGQVLLPSMSVDLQELVPPYRVVRDVDITPATMYQWSKEIQNYCLEPTATAPSFEYKPAALPVVPCNIYAMAAKAYMADHPLVTGALNCISMTLDVVTCDGDCTFSIPTSNEVMMTWNGIVHPSFHGDNFAPGMVVRITKDAVLAEATLLTNSRCSFREYVVVTDRFKYRIVSRDRLDYLDCMIVNMEMTSASLDHPLARQLATDENG